MCFLEFLETCTIEWVLICEGGVGIGKENPENAFFFEKFYRGHDLPHPRLAPYTPPVSPCTLQRTRTACTAQASGQAAPNARQTAPRTDTHARILDTLHRFALDTRQAARGRSYRRRGAGRRGACPKLCRFGHIATAKKYISFLNTFVAHAA